MLLCRENEPGWDMEIQDDVIEECKKHGGVVHIYVDKNSAEVSDHLYTVAIEVYTPLLKLQLFEMCKMNPRKSMSELFPSLMQY